MMTTPNTVIIAAEGNFSIPTEEVLKDVFDIKRISVEKISFAQGLKKLAFFIWEAVTEYYGDDRDDCEVRDV